MGMLVVDDNDFEYQVNNTCVPSTVTNPVTKPVEPKISEVLPARPRGRGKHNVEVPNALRQLIGGTSFNEGRGEAVALAREFGISPQSASAYAHGATSLASYNSPSVVNSNHIQKVKDNISKRAQKKLKLALTHIDDEKLGASSAKDLSGVAKDMSIIVKAMEPTPTTIAGANAPQFIIYSPTVVDEKHFETVIINE